MYVYIYVYVWVFVFVCVCMCIYVCVYLHVYVCVHLCVYSHSSSCFVVGKVRISNYIHGHVSKFLRSKWDYGHSHYHPSDMPNPPAGCIILIGFACPHSVFKAPKWYADIPVQLCSMHNHENGFYKLCFYSYALWVHKYNWFDKNGLTHTQQ